MTNEQQAEFAELNKAIEIALTAHAEAREIEIAAEAPVIALREEAAALKVKRQEAARALENAAEIARDQWREFRRIEAQLKAAQHRAGLKPIGADPQVLKVNGIPSAEAFGVV